MQTKKFLSLLLALAMMFSLAVTASAEEEEEAKSLEGRIVILHTNDVHGAIGNYAKVAALKGAFEDAGAYTLLMDAGDYIQGDPTVSVSQGKSAIELMNLAGYDAATIGNHEFDYGYPNFKEVTKDAKFPVVSANVLYNGAAENAHTVFTAPGGEKIGVFGLTTSSAWATWASTTSLRATAPSTSSRRSPASTCSSTPTPTPPSRRPPPPRARPWRPCRSTGASSRARPLPSPSSPARPWSPPPARSWPTWAP